MPYEVESLLEMSPTDLDRIYRNSPAGDIPSGEARGMVIIHPGHEPSEIAARLTHTMAWQGKVFDPASATLKNRILPVHINSIVAKVYKAPSWIDGRECIVLDYSQTSLVAQHMRDEMRLIAPDTYLGFAFWGHHKLMGFALQFQPVSAPESPEEIHPVAPV